MGAANVNTALQPQIQAATAAQAALLEASLTQPVNQADLRAKAQALADAETKLALARADLLVTVQQALRPLDTAQAIAALSGRGGGRGGPPVPDNYDGFVSLFDGRTLDGWNGDPMFWSVKDGVLHAESTPEKVVGGVIPGNTFLIWKGQGQGLRAQGGLPLRRQWQQRRPDSIPHVRSDQARRLSVRGACPATSWIWSPPGAPGSGVFYTEGGGFGLTPQGMAMRAFEGPDRTVQMRQIGSLGTSVADAIKPGPEWNTYHIIAHNNLIVAFINGRMVAMLVDDNRSGAAVRPGWPAGAPDALRAAVRRRVQERLPERDQAGESAGHSAPAGQGRGGG